MVKMKFVGFLSKVDSSIQKLELKHNFKIEGVSSANGKGLLSKIEKADRFSIVENIERYRLLNNSEGRIYFITNSFETENNTYSTPLAFLELLQNYLNPLLELLKLFKEGIIDMPLSYIYPDNTPHGPLEKYFSSKISLFGPIYSLTDNEVQDFQTFFEKVVFPFQDSTLVKCFKVFQLSYQIQDLNIAFLSLLIGFEILFNPAGDQELKSRVARNVAVLLGKEGQTGLSENEWSSNRIYKDVLDFYKKKADLIYRGTLEINRDLFLKAREYLRRAIKEFYKIGKTKNNLLELLNIHGFGDKSKIDE
jgi:hypothetical protein